MPAIGALALALLALPYQPSVAQERASEATDARERAIIVKLEQFKVVQDQDGKEQFVPAPDVKPGDIVEYRATYRNQSKFAVAGLTAELPIPDGTEYLPRSAAPARLPVEAKTKEESYAREPLVRVITEADGTVRKVPVPYAEYRSLRWSVGELSAGSESMVSARVRIAPLIDESSEQPGDEAAAQRPASAPERSAASSAGRSL